MSFKISLNLLSAILLVLAPLILAGISYYCFLRRRKREEREQVEITDQTISADDDFSKAEPPLTEIRATILRMRCEVNTYGTKIPQCREEYFITFADEYENKLTYCVDKDTYLHLSEGQKGTIAIVNDRFYGFSKD